MSPQLGFRNPHQLFVSRSTTRANCELPFRIHRNHTPFSRLITTELQRKPAVSFGRSDRLLPTFRGPQRSPSVLAGGFVQRGSQITITSTCAVLRAQPAVNHLERLLPAVPVVSALFFHEERGGRTLFRERENYVNRRQLSSTLYTQSRHKITSSYVTQRRTSMSSFCQRKKMKWFACIHRSFLMTSGD